MERFEECVEDVSISLNAVLYHWNASFKPTDIDVGNARCLLDIILPWSGQSEIFETGETKEYENTFDANDHRSYSVTLKGIFQGTDATFVVIDVCYRPSLHVCERTEICMSEPGSDWYWHNYTYNGVFWYTLLSTSSDSCVIGIYCPWDNSGSLDDRRDETFMDGTIKTFEHDDYPTGYYVQVGNIYEYSVDIIVCDDCLVPRIDDIIVTPETHVVGEDVTFEIVPNTRSGTLDNIWFKHDDAYPDPMPTPYKSTFVKKYYAPGTYVASAKVDNECGRISEVITTEVVIDEECPPPVVTSMSWAPTMPKVGEPVQFSATADPGSEDYTITSWYWEFGDGHTGSGQTTEHVYTTQGSFDVSVTVINSCQAWSEDFIETVTIDEPLGVTTTICEGAEENCGTHRAEQIYGRELFTDEDRCGWLHSFCLFGCESVPWNATDTFDLSLLPVGREVVVVHIVAVGLEPNANYAFNVKWFDPDNSIISNITTDPSTGVYTHDEIEWIGYTTSEIEKNGEYRVEVDLFEDGFPVFQIIKKTFSITGIPCAQPYCVFEVI